MDSAQLTPSHQRRIEVFQLKGLRKILQMRTTSVERTNTNKEVYRRANELIKNESAPGKIPKRIVPFVTCYLNSRIKRLIRLDKMNATHPVRHITLGTDRGNRLVPWTPPNRRVGRPRFKWVMETMNDFWSSIAQQHTHTLHPRSLTKKATMNNMRHL